MAGQGHRHTGWGCRGGVGVAGVCGPPKILGNSDFLGSKNNLGKPVLKDVFKLFFIFCYFLFLPEVGIVKPVIFTRDTGCLTHDELLVISKGDDKLIYKISIFLFFGEALYCTTLY